MHVDFKITTWERCELPDDLTPEEIETIKEKIKTGIISCYNDLEEECGVPHNEIILGVEEYMTPEDNGGCSTVEFYNAKGESASAINTNE